MGLPRGRRRKPHEGGAVGRVPDEHLGPRGETLDDAGEEVSPAFPEILGGPHKARHTFASHFLQAKPDLFLLGRILGHTHTRVTELHSHLLPEHLAEGRNIVSFAGEEERAAEAIAEVAKREMDLAEGRTAS